MNYNFIDTRFNLTPLQAQMVRLWNNGVDFEEEALKQLANIARMPILAGPLAAMPDTHWGMGATVGSVIPTRSAIIPAAVGVDLGCGMLAVLTSLTADDLPQSLSRLRSAIEAAIPVGFNEHKGAVRTFNQGHLGHALHEEGKFLNARYQSLEIVKRIRSKDRNKAWNQAGTLGGGNHFIEVCLDTENRVWLMLHSGSRGIGNQIGTVAISEAKEYATRTGAHSKIADMNLAWFDEGTQEFDDYVEGITWAQDYAKYNRDLMLHLLIQVMNKEFRHFRLLESIINCHHNYAKREIHNGESIWITRKGAVSARIGEMGIIPGSMGAKSFIVRGLGNPDSYCSCSHGAGRKMSRSKAKTIFTRKDLEEQTAGVECRKDKDVIDEIPGAYKDIDAVMAAQSDLVEVVAQLKQVLCIKG
jgi:tRNA-splicing ligase RtcB